MKCFLHSLSPDRGRGLYRITGILGLLWVSAFARANDSLPVPTHEQSLATGVDLRIWNLSDPIPRSVYALDLDLNQPHIRSAFSLGGADPDGNGDFHATNLTVLATAERLQLDVAVNAGVVIQPPESSNAGDGWGKAYPCTMVNGSWLTPPPERSRATVVVIHRDGRFSICSALEVPEDARHAFPAHTGQLVENGEPCRLSTLDSSTATSQHPRTAIGVDEPGLRITLLVVDGRDPAEAVGMTTDTLEDWMVRLGVYDAANLWGGGNTVLVLRERPMSPLRVFNRPSDHNAQGFIRLRSAQTTLGFTIYGSSSTGSRR